MAGKPKEDQDEMEWADCPTCEGGKRYNGGRDCPLCHGRRKLKVTK